MIRKIKAVYVDETGQKTEESLILEIALNNKDQPDFKQKSEVFGCCKVINEDTGKLESYPFIAIHINGYLLVDFGDTFDEYSKEQLETPAKPKFIRYLHIQTKDLDPKVGKSIIVEYAGGKHPYQITRIEDYK